MNGKTVYLLLFRGVGGATQLPTAPLRAALTKAGFEQVATYINSGNAVLRTTLARDRLIEQVAEIVARQFDFTKAIYAATLAEWSALIECNPFQQAVATPSLLHVALLADKPKAESVDAIQALAQDGEQFQVIGNVAYLHTPSGFGRSHMAARFDKLIGVGNTARNWNTVTKLHALALVAASAAPAHHFP
ncbi:MAG: DUF1697 domain-containing protein [Burkholderiaceae bacterium]|jgi:uncharacterized protein (DUF1697 family)|nr:DUF1697 domain-containing protein [Burkholderiaceae bacterium]